MSLYGALFTAVSGLKAQANKIGVISDNIANVNTVGYKGTTAQFETLVVNSGGVAYSPGGVLPNNRMNIDKQGLLLATDAPTDISISGAGFFVVNGRQDSSGTPLYTRAGSFRKDELGNFKNAAGHYLQGWALDRNGNLPATSANLDSLSTVNIETATGVASATTQVSIGANFDASEDIFEGVGGTIDMDPLSTVNFGIAADDIILPDEYNLAPINSIVRGDQFTISTGNGLSYNYTYDGFTIGRDITTAGAGNFGDGGTNIAAAVTLAAGDLDYVAGGSTFTITIPGHGLIDGDQITLAGVVLVPANVPLDAELNTTHTITRVDANTISITVTTAHGQAAGAATAGAETANIRQFSGNIFDATTASQAFLGTIGTAGFTTASRSFTITTQTTGTVTFRYVTSFPSAIAGEFNNLNNLASAIDQVVGLTARVQNGRLVVGLEDANESLAFANGDATGTSTLRGIDWITELDLAGFAAGTRRFSTMQGLANIVNDDTGVSASISNPLSNASMQIRVNDPLDTIQFDDFVQNPATAIPNNAITTEVAGVPGAPVLATALQIVIADPSIPFAVGDVVQLAGIATGNAALDAVLNGGTFPVTATTAATEYVVTIPASLITAAVVAGGAVAAGGGAAGTAAQTNNGSLIAELGLVASLNSAAYTPQSTGVLGPRYDTSGTVGQNLASGDLKAQFTRSLRVYDALGAPHDLTMAIIKIAENEWAAEIFAVPESDVSTSLVDGQVALGTITFNGDGTLRSVSSGLSNPITINWTNGAVPSEITFDWGTAGQPIGTVGTTQIGGTDGLSQFSSDYNVAFVEQNGSQVGELIAVSINNEGIVTASFSNGETQDLYKIPLADFANPNGLNAISGNVFSQTRDSGEVNLREAGTNGTGTVVAATLESSNVELSEQLTDLIVAQRAYQSNTKAITASDDLLEELNRL
jgi:flagellar hook-basal body protein